MKKVVVNKKFLNDLADKIYNSKTKKFLYLCAGTLTNGPDPTNKNRKMHCGLGELYFAMTGKHAKGMIDEGNVIDLAVKLSTLNFDKEKQLNLFNKKISFISNKFKDLLLNVDNYSKYAFESAIRNIEMLEPKNVLKFKEALENIANINDCGNGICAKNSKESIYKNRAQRVAKAFRKVAKLLPK